MQHFTKNDINECELCYENEHLHKRFEIETRNFVLIALNFINISIFL